MKMSASQATERPRPDNEAFYVEMEFSPAERQANIDSAHARGLPACVYRAERPGKVAIVASGPSARDYVDTFKEWDGELWGVNGAFAWLLHRGCKPTAFVGIDPHPMLKDYLINTPDDAAYYLASQVDPSVFDHLAGKNVRLWTASDREVKHPNGVYQVPGGTTCATRAPYLAALLGWTEVHLFGIDSSFEGETHVYGGATTPEKPIFAGAGGKTFASNLAFIQQASDAVEVAQNFPGTLYIHGRGLAVNLAEEALPAFEMTQAYERAELMAHNRQSRRAAARMAKKKHAHDLHRV